MKNSFDYWVCDVPLGDAPDFKWEGWSNGSKNKNSTKSLGLQTESKKIPGPNFNPKKSHAKFPSHKNFQRNHAAGIRRNYLKSSDCFEYPKNSRLKLSYPKKYLPKFSYPKKSRDRKFQTQTNPSITPVTLNPEYLHWVMCRRKWSQFPFNPQTYKGGRGEHPLRFFCFFSKTIKRQHLKFSVAVRLSLQYHGGGMTLRVRPRVKANRES